MAMANAPQSTPPPAAPKPRLRSPDHRELIMLAVGLALGLLLSPAVLGQFAPQAYNALFDAGPLPAELAASQASMQQAIERLAQSGATGVSLEEYQLQRSDQLRQQAYLQHAIDALRDAQAFGWVMALMAPLVALMIIEPICTPAGRAASRLATARFALAAAWLALVMARPTLLTRMPIALVGGLLLISLCVSFVPLPGSQRPSPASD